MLTIKIGGEQKIPTSGEGTRNSPFDHNLISRPDLDVRLTNGKSEVISAQNLRSEFTSQNYPTRTEIHTKMYISNVENLNQSIEVEEKKATRYLLAHYQKRNYSMLPSFFDELRLPINSCFVQVIMLRKSKQQAILAMKLKSSNKLMNDYAQLRSFEAEYFSHDDTYHESVNLRTMLTNHSKILIIGEAGMGKTTWCLRLAFMWSNVQYIEADSATEGRNINYKLGNEEKLDTKFLQDKFKFCFVFRLRNIEHNLNFEMAKMCKHPFTEQSCEKFIFSHSSEILFVLGMFNFAPYCIIQFTLIVLAVYKKKPTICRINFTSFLCCRRV